MTTFTDNARRRMVYLDPLDCTRPEGVATLCRKLSGAEDNGHYNGRAIERWMVRFDGDGNRQVQRTILGALEHPV